MAEPVVTYLKHEEVAMSGVKAVATAGTAVVLGSQVVGCALRVKALTTNTGLIYVGNDGADDVASTNGFPLSAGQDVIFAYVANLGDIYIDSAVDGESVAWLILEVK